MGFFDFFKTRDSVVSEQSDEGASFEEVFGLVSDRVSVSDALEIPIVNACISRISDVIASTDLKMYEITDEGRVEIFDDPRVKLINTKLDNGSLNNFEFKKLIVRDYFLKGHCFFYIDRKGNFIKDIKYLDNVFVSYNNNVFDKRFDVVCGDRKLKLYDTLRITRNSNNGVKGVSIIEESGLHFLMILKTMERLLIDAKRGFLPKGMFKMEKNIKNIDALRRDVKKMLSDNNSGYIFLNNGISYEPLDKNRDAENEAKANASELNKIASMFGVPVSIINGGANEDDKFNFINFTILPLLSTIEASLNRDLLLEKEQGRYYFAFDIKDLLKGNMKERFEAYQLAIKNNIMSMDEVRDLENMPRLNFGFYKFNIADAMYYKDDDKDINMLINVNTNTAIDLNKVLDSEFGDGVLKLTGKGDSNFFDKDSGVNSTDKNVNADVADGADKNVGADGVGSGVVKKSE